MVVVVATATVVVLAEVAAAEVEVAAAEVEVGTPIPVYVLEEQKKSCLKTLLKKHACTPDNKFTVWLH